MAKAALREPKMGEFYFKGQKVNLRGVFLMEREEG